MRTILLLFFSILLCNSLYAQVEGKKNGIEKKEIKRAEKERRKELLSQERNNRKYQNQRIKESEMAGDKKAVKTEKNAEKEEKKIRQRQKSSSKKDASY